MYNFIVFLPLIGALLAWVLGDRWSSRLSYFVTIFCMSLAMIISWIAFFDLTTYHELRYIYGMGRAGGLGNFK